MCTDTIYIFDTLTLRVSSTHQWRSTSWARVGHDPPEKIKKLMIIGLICEILYNFVSVLGFV